MLELINVLNYGHFKASNNSNTTSKQVIELLFYFTYIPENEMAINFMSVS